MRLAALAILAAMCFGQTKVDWITQVKNKPFLEVAEYNWSLSPSNSVTVGSNSIVVHCPVGLAASQSAYISGGTGTAEPVSITGTCTGGSPPVTGTIIFTAANTHSGAWSIKSATSGWQEAAQAGGPGKQIHFMPGTYYLKTSFTVPFDGQTYFADGPSAATITVANGTNLHRFVITGSKADISFRNLGWDGNFANQTYTPATLNTAIDGTGSVRLKVIGNKFHAFGDFIANGYAQVISFYSSNDCEARDNNFYSNIAIEINMNGAHGCAATGNSFGSPRLSDSKVGVNYWDTYAGGFGAFAANSDGVYFANNRMYGTARAVSSGSITGYGNLIGVDGSDGPTSANIHIENNYADALGNVMGTVSVTNGSGTISGTNTVFTAIDTKRQFIIEGDATLYTVTAYTSPTSITVTPVVARASASGLRFQMTLSGDMLVLYNVQKFNISGNTIFNSGDNGMDIAASGVNATGDGVMADNLVSHSRNDGLFVGGQMFNVLFANNIFSNNNQQSLSGHEGAIELSPTNQGSVTAQPMWHLTFANNQCVDDQSPSTQIYCMQVETAQAAHIFSNTLTGNTFFNYNGGSPTGGFFNSEVTATMQGAMFNQTGLMSSVQFTPVAFADLGNIDGHTPANGTVAYCFDCAIANPCAGSGTGAFAKRLAGAWVCN